MEHGHFNASEQMRDLLLFDTDDEFLLVVHDCHCIELCRLPWRGMYPTPVPIDWLFVHPDCETKT
jgi:hypothetical protein